MRHSHLEKHLPAKNVARFYHLAVVPNLFGEWTLLREWGRIGAPGRTRMDLFQSEALAIAALLAIEAAKRKRGYWLEPQQLDMFG